MKIISFLNSKGGVGKTTLCVNISSYLYIQMLRNEDLPPRILLVDADPQGSVRDWQEEAGQNQVDVIAADRPATLRALLNLLSNNPYDYVLIDTPGKVNDIMATAISISDLCLIPVCPSPYDLWATTDIVEMIQTRQQLTHGSPDAYFVLNRCIPNTKLGKDVQEILGNHSLTVLGKPIHQRVVYAETAMKGKTIFKSSNLDAQAEITYLGNSILGVLNETRA